MAKKSSLGKGLDALLGGASRQARVHDRGTNDTAVARGDGLSSTTDIGAGHRSDSSSDKGLSNGASPEISSPASAALSPDVAHKPARPEVSPAQPTVATGVNQTATQPKTNSTENSGANSNLSNGEKLISLPIERIRRGSYQPRQQFDKEALQELADSIKAQGMIQPILVRPFADGYEIIAGERRWRAAQLAEMHSVPAIVRELDDKSVAAVSLIENIQRKDLNPLEEARALQRLQSEFGMTHQAVADAVGRSRASVTNLMRLLDLHDEVKVMVDKGELDMGHARALLAITGDEQLALARQIAAKGLSVRAAEQLVRSAKEPSEPSKPERRDADIVSLEKSLGRTLAAAVNIRHQSSGKGKLEINYNSLDELEGILSHIK